MLMAFTALLFVKCRHFIHPSTLWVVFNLHNRLIRIPRETLKLKTTVRIMHTGYISQADIIKNDCKCNGNAMHLKVRFSKPLSGKRYSYS